MGNAKIDRLNAIRARRRAREEAAGTELETTDEELTTENAGVAVDENGNEHVGVLPVELANAADVTELGESEPEEWVISESPYPSREGLIVGSPDDALEGETAVTKQAYLDSFEDLDDLEGSDGLEDSARDEDDAEEATEEEADAE